MFTVNYTWSKALADIRSNFLDSGDSYFPLDRHYNYGPTNNDRRHIFVASYTYRLPIFTRTRGFLRSAFGGWELSGITRFQTGQLLTVTGTSSNAAQARRATYLGGDTALPSDQRGRDKWFNTAAFSRPPVDGLGNAGIGTVVGPPWHVWYLTLRKEFAVRESVKLRFRADTFNTFNHVNLNNPNVNVNADPGFGTISNGQPPRQIQFGLNLSF